MTYVPLATPEVVTVDALSLMWERLQRTQDLLVMADRIIAGQATLAERAAWVRDSRADILDAVERQERDSICPPEEP